MTVALTVSFKLISFFTFIFAVLLQYTIDMHLALIDRKYYPEVRA